MVKGGTEKDLEVAVTYSRHHPGTIFIFEACILLPLSLTV
jgi:hypothetical protein